MADALFQYVIRLADDQLILAHRISEWCGHAPLLEEDLALPNIALDMLGQARVLYTHAGEIEGKGRDEDDLAYLRLERDYRNLLLCELENGDFAHTVLRIFLFASFMELYWEKMLASSDTTLAGAAERALRETRYHVRHSAEWVIRLGDGTQESASRLADAHDDLAPYCAEMFETDEVTAEMVSLGIATDPHALRDTWKRNVEKIYREAMLDRPAPLDGWQTGGRSGRHVEAMGHLLAELQYMQRTYPGMTW